MADTRPTISSILSDDLLHSIAPYLHPRDISALSLTSLRNYAQITSTPSIHRYTDLSSEPKPHSKQEDESPEVQRFLRCERLLSVTRTLVLDGTPVTLPQVQAILASPSSAITILSLLGCKRVNELDLIEYLKTPGTPKPKGLYWFTLPAVAADASALTTGSRFVRKPRHAKLTDWAPALAATLSSVCFDTRICRGARHALGDPKIATIALRGSCAGCRAMPDALVELEPVLVAPAPLHSSTLRAACKGPDGKAVADCLRCEACARNRFCEGCGKWWCESCAVDKKHVKRSCFECGFQCTECTAAASRICEACRSGYCINHNEGADDTRCEWCYLSNKRRPSISCTVAATSNAFLTSPASSYYAYLQQTQPGNTFVKHPPSPPSTASVRGIGGGVGRMRGIGAPAPGAGGVVAGRHFQNEAIVRRRGLLNN